MHFVVDICVDDLFILDPENPQVESKYDADNTFFDASSSPLSSSFLNVNNNNSIQMRTKNESAEIESRETVDINDPVSIQARAAGDEVIQAAKQGDLNLLRKLHQEGVNLVVLDENGMTALHHAARNGYENIVGFLLSAAPSSLLNVSENNNGHTALHKAAIHRRHNICSMLASCGASLTKADNQGLTAKQLASQAGDEELAAYLERKSTRIRLAC